VRRVPATPILASIAFLLGVTIVACSREAATPQPGRGRPATLDGTAWKLVAVQGRPVAGSGASLAFARGGVSGDGGCNRFGGSFSYESATGALTIDALASTKRACLEPARNDLEAAYLRALRGVSAATIDSEGRLVLSGSGAELVLVATRQPDGAAAAAAITGRP
jgi:heat shock protein HslJ